MDALKFWNELQRICGIFKSCDDCPLYEEVCMGCSLYDIEDIKRTIQSRTMEQRISAENQIAGFLGKAPKRSEGR